MGLAIRILVLLALGVSSFAYAEDEDATIGGLINSYRENYRSYFQKRQSLVSELANIDAELAQANKDFAKLTVEYQTQQSQLASINKLKKDGTSKLGSLQTRVESLQSSYEDLITQYSEGHPEVLRGQVNPEDLAKKAAATKNQIEQIKAQVKDYKAQLIAYKNAPEYIGLTQKKSGIDDSLANLDQSQAAYKAKLAKAKGTIDGLTKQAKTTDGEIGTLEGQRAAIEQNSILPLKDAIQAERVKLKALEDAQKVAAGKADDLKGAADGVAQQIEGNRRKILVSQAQIKRNQDTLADYEQKLARVSEKQILHNDLQSNKLPEAERTYAEKARVLNEQNAKIDQAQKDLKAMDAALANIQNQLLTTNSAKAKEERNLVNLRNELGQINANLQQAGNYQKQQALYAEQANKAQAVIAAADVEIKKQNAVIADAQAKMRTAKPSKVPDNSDRISALRDRQKAIDKDLNTNRAKLRGLRDRYEDMDPYATNALKRLRADMTALNTKIESLEDQRDELQKQINALSKAGTAPANSTAALEKIISQANAAIVAQQAKRLKAQTDLNETLRARGSLDGLMNDIKEQQVRMGDLQARFIPESQARIAKMDADILRMYQEQSQKTFLRPDIAQKIAAMGAGVKLVADAADAALNDLNDVKQKIAKAREFIAQASQFQSKKEELNRSTAGENQNIQKFNDEIARLNQKAADIQAQRDAAGADLDAAAGRVREKKSFIDKKLSELAAFTANSSSLQTRIDAVYARKAAEQKTLAQARIDLDQAAQAMKKYEETKAGLKAQQQDASDDIDLFYSRYSQNLLVKISKAQQQADELQDQSSWMIEFSVKVTKITGDLNAARGELGQIQGRDFDTEIYNKEADVFRAKKAYDVADSGIKEIQKRRDGQLNALKATTTALKAFEAEIDKNLKVQR